MEELILDDVEREKTTRTPEWAGFWIRVVASIIDTIVFIPLFFVMFYTLGEVKSFSLVLAITLIMAAYKPLMEARWGATLGKMAVRIRVVNAQFQRITPGQAVLRYLPWLLGNAISIVTYAMLFGDARFAEASGMLEISSLQTDVVSPALSYLDSLLIIVCCVVVAFHDQKRGLHDMLADTYCVLRS